MAANTRRRALFRIPRQPGLCERLRSGRAQHTNGLGILGARWDAIQRGTTIAPLFSGGFIMKYGLAWFLGVPPAIVAIWFLVNHC
jgi:hypothetical protein